MRRTHQRDYQCDLRASERPSRELFLRRVALVLKLPQFDHLYGTKFFLVWPRRRLIYVGDGSTWIVISCILTESVHILSPPTCSPPAMRFWSVRFPGGVIQF